MTIQNFIKKRPYLIWHTKNFENLDLSGELDLYKLGRLAGPQVLNACIALTNNEFPVFRQVTDLINKGYRLNSMTFNFIAGSFIPKFDIVSPSNTVPVIGKASSNPSLAQKIFTPYYFLVWLPRRAIFPDIKIPPISIPVGILIQNFKAL